MRITLTWDGYGDVIVGCGGRMSAHSMVDGALDEVRALLTRLDVTRSAPPKDVPLERLRLELLIHDSHLLLVGDLFGEGGRYVQVEIPWAESEKRTWPDWDLWYERLEATWRKRYQAGGED